MSDTFSTTQEVDPNEWAFDPTPEDLTTEGVSIDVKALPEVRAIIRTSDRIQYRNCRRRWGWSSHLRGNLGPKTDADPLWMGSGFHFALEDFHGANIYGSPANAFKAFARATLIYNKNKVPADWDSLTLLAIDMLGYYANSWLIGRDPLRTFIWQGRAQTEVNFRIHLPWDQGRFGFDSVVYSGTLDRVIEDESGGLWIVEYKTAKTIQTLHLAIDAQVSAYCWAGNYLYGRPIEGVIYQQHLKAPALPPKILSNGTISFDKRQRTTHRLYREAILNLYGSIDKAPLPNLDLLNALATKETQTTDAFVRRDMVHRNEHQAQAEGVKVLMEVEEMLNPETYLYPNPRRECLYFCPFYGPCGSLDDGSDWQYELEGLMAPREKVYDSWRTHLQLPHSQQQLQLQQQPQLPPSFQPLLLESAVPSQQQP